MLRTSNVGGDETVSNLGCLMSESEEQILNELRRQSDLLESIEKSQSETNDHLKVIGTLIVLAACALVLYLILF